MHNLLGNLLQEIERQRSLCEDSCTIAKPNAAAKEGLGSPDLTYGQALSDLKNDLVEASKLSEGTDWHNVKLRYIGLLWQIPSRCSTHHSFHPPEDLREQCRAIQKSRDLRGSSESHTDSIWNDPQLQQWASAKESSLLLVEGKGTANKRVERFGLEMVDYLEEKGHSPVYFPNIITLDDIAPEMQPSASGLLRQLAIQTLQKVRPANAIELLARTVENFQKSDTNHSWATTLGHICQYAPDQLFIVVDLGALRGDVSETQGWAPLLLSLFDRLNAESHPVLLKCILLNYRDATPLPAPDQLRTYFVCVKPQSPLPPSTMRKLVHKQRKEEGLNKRAGKMARPALYQPESRKHSPKPIEYDVSPIRDTIPKERSPPRTRDSIRIVIICALTLEADAVEALFDRHWDDEGLPFEGALGDTNAYSVGAVGDHNVLLLHMAGMGKVEAARAAATCRASFPNIRLALLVGICGGVPSGGGREIILGDVIISDGIVQYDFGRQFAGSFIRKNTLVDNLGRPNSEIRGLLSKLKGLRGRELLGRQMANDLKVLERTPLLAASYPGASRDVLFDPAYHHVGEGTCAEAGCDGRLVCRARLQQSEPEPVVHFGLVASGDKVIKSAGDRDSIATAEGVIGFEMEGAGIWDTFPCVVIKGVCDYADSHKSKSWQRYAAATAAACMKGFLKNVSRHESK